MDVFSIAPSTGHATVGGEKIVTHGVSLRKLTKILQDNPSVLTAIQSGLGDRGNIASLVAQSPDAALALMTFGLRAEDNKKTQAWLDDLPLSDQCEIIKAILDRTTDGTYIRPFLGLVLSFLNTGPTPAASEQNPAPSPNLSEAPSSTSSVEDTLATNSGT